MYSFLHLKRVTKDPKSTYNETTKLNFFFQFDEKYFRCTPDFWCIFNLKLVIQSIAIDIEHSTGYSNSPWIITKKLNF